MTYLISIASEPVLTFGILLLLILLAPLLFRSIKLPGIVGLILAGTIIGPSGFAIMEAEGVIDLLGKVGLLYLMFLAGLDINLEQFKEERKNTAVFGALTFLIPQSVGTLVFYSLDYSLPASLLIASMFASHTLVAYPIISRLGLIKDKSITAAVGGTIFTDIAALLVLAGVARSIDGDLSVMFWITLAALFSLLLVFMFYVLPKVSYQFFTYIGEQGRYTYVYVIGVMLICSWLAEVIGVESIVGAFLAGLALNRLMSNKGSLKNRIDFFGDAFFIPIFLVYVGMQVDLEILGSSSEVWLIMTIMTFIVVLTKWLAAFLSSRILGFSSDQAWVMFGLTNSQAAATLAAVFVGIEIEIIGSEVLNGTIMMIMVTCIIGPLVVEKFGSRLAYGSAADNDTPTRNRQRILVPVSNPETTARLIELASNIRRSGHDGIYPLSVFNTFSQSEPVRYKTQQILDMASGQIHAVESDAFPIIETNLNVADGIRIAAEKHAITDIVIGWNGVITTPMKLFGSILDQVIATAQQNIFVCKLSRPTSTIQRLVVVVPSNVLTGTTYIKTIETLLQLAENLNSQPVFVCTELDEDKLKRDLYIIDNKKEFHIDIIGTTAQLKESHVAKAQVSDLFVILGKRLDRYDWSAGEQMVPQMIAGVRPDLDFVVAFPAARTSTSYLSGVLHNN